MMPDIFPLSDLIEMGDALLASPILALEIQLAGGEGLEAVIELRHRAGQHMLIGIGGIETISQTEMALRADPHFITTSGFNFDIAKHLIRAEKPYTCEAATLDKAKTALKSGCSVLKLHHLDPAQTKPLQIEYPETLLIPTTGVTLDNISDYINAGITTVGVSEAIISRALPTMAHVITQARRWRTAWQQAQQR